MSDFKFSCPKCSQSIVCDVSNAGMQIPCPACQTLLTVPKPQPTAPEVPTPGKLTINKTAHQSHTPAPAPGAANAPAKPAWGMKAAPLPPPKKKFPVVPIAVTCAILAALAVGWFAFGAPYLKQQQEKKRQAEEEAQRQAAAQAKAAAEAARPKPKPTWRMDLANAKFPELAASGKLHGADFSVENAIFQSGTLTLVQTSGSPHQFVIGLPLKPGETLTDKTFDVTSTNTNVFNQPRVVLNWKDDSGKLGMESFTKGIAMKLEFGNAADGRLPAKIYLCLPDTNQSFVAGTFQISPKGTPGQMQPAAAPVGSTAGRRRGS